MEEKTEQSKEPNTEQKLPESEQKITKDMMIGDLIVNFPKAVEILMDEGIGCIGCGGAAYESIEQGLVGHGKSEEEIKNILEKMNEAIKS